MIIFNNVIDIIHEYVLLNYLDLTDAAATAAAAAAYDDDIQLII